MKIISIIFVSMAVIIGILSMTYKPMYSVIVEGENLGYIEDKSEFQRRINDYINGEGNNVAFIQIDKLPVYKLCLTKRNVQANEEDIFNKISDSGKTYYKYYAITNNGEENLYVSTLEEAEEVIGQLKNKDSKNKEQIAIIEKYDENEKEVSSVEKCVASLYQQNVMNKTKTTTKKDKGQDLREKVSGTNSSLKGTNKTNSKIEIGIAFINPTSGVITSRFGIRTRNYHTGLDIGAPKGTPIKAAASGTVTFSGYSGGYGNKVVISHGNGIETVYAHCSKLLTSAGANVKQGDVIANVGTTGTSTGNHLHFEVRVNGVAQNPQNYVY